jgi:hypothetical protein
MREAVNARLHAVPMAVMRQGMSLHHDANNLAAVEVILPMT